METFGVDFCTVTSLSTRPDRLKRFRTHRFASVVHEVVRRQSHVQPRDDCFEAHRLMWQLGQDTSPTSIQAVFEDDAMWTSAAAQAQKIEAAHAVKKIIQLFPSWDIIYLGGIPLTRDTGQVGCGVKGVLRCRVTEAHAYILSPNFRARLLATRQYGGVDIWLARQAGQSFCLETELVTQDSGLGSDIFLLPTLFQVRNTYKA